MDVELLENIASAAFESRPPVHVILALHGFIFDMRWHPYHLSHYVSFLQLQDAGFPLVRKVIGNMQREMAEAVRDAKEARSSL